MWVGGPLNYMSGPLKINESPQLHFFVECGWWPINNMSGWTHAMKISGSPNFTFFGMWVGGPNENKLVEVQTSLFC